MENCSIEFWVKQASVFSCNLIPGNVWYRRNANNRIVIGSRGTGKKKKRKKKSEVDDAKAINVARLACTLRFWWCCDLLRRGHKGVAARARLQTGFQESRGRGIIHLCQGVCSRVQREVFARSLPMLLEMSEAAGGRMVACNSRIQHIDRS